MIDDNNVYNIFLLHRCSNNYLYTAYSVSVVLVVNHTCLEVFERYDLTK